MTYGMIWQSASEAPALKEHSARRCARLEECQAQAAKELRPRFGRTLTPSVPDRVFEGEL